MVSTTPISIQPSSLNTTGTASAIIAPNSLFQFAGVWLIRAWSTLPMYPADGEAGGVESRSNANFPD
jgi:hypothetical protein